MTDAVAGGAGGCECCACRKSREKGYGFHFEWVGGDRMGFLLMVECGLEWVDCCFFVVLGRGGKGGWSF